MVLQDRTTQDNTGQDILAAAIPDGRAGLETGSGDEGDPAMTMQTTTTDAPGPAGEPGMNDGRHTDPGARAMVRALLVDRLSEAGLRRPRGVTADQLDKTLARLVDHLAYMHADNVETLAETLLDPAHGGQWPSEVVIRQFAHALQPPPRRRHRIVTSWLASREGPQAEVEGCLVELFRFLLRHSRPPLPMDRRLIRDQAEANRREQALIRDRIERDVATDADREWLARYMADTSEARALVAAGQAVRAGGDA